MFVLHYYTLERQTSRLRYNICIVYFMKRPVGDKFDFRPKITSFHSRGELIVGVRLFRRWSKSLWSDYNSFPRKIIWKNLKSAANGLAYPKERDNFKMRTDKLWYYWKRIRLIHQYLMVQLLNVVLFIHWHCCTSAPEIPLTDSWFTINKLMKFVLRYFHFHSYISTHKYLIVSFTSK